MLGSYLACREMPANGTAYDSIFVSVLSSCRCCRRMGSQLLVAMSHVLLIIPTMFGIPATGRVLFQIQVRVVGPYNMTGRLHVPSFKAPCRVRSLHFSYKAKCRRQFHPNEMPYRISVVVGGVGQAGADIRPALSTCHHLHTYMSCAVLQVVRYYYSWLFLTHFHTPLHA